MEMIIQATGKSCTREQLVSIEHTIINVIAQEEIDVQELQWHLLTGTLADWTLYFIRRLHSDDHQVPFDLYYRCMDLCDRLLLDADVSVYILYYDCSTASTGYKRYLQLLFHHFHVKIWSYVGMEGGIDGQNHLLRVQLMNFH